MHQTVQQIWQGRRISHGFNAKFKVFAVPSMMSTFHVASRKIAGVICMLLVCTYDEARTFEEWLPLHHDFIVLEEIRSE